ncbi:DUF3549 family protein [Vibrio navarrensis]|uniref:DUF3549 family protein n=1 Tax=Vibrio navarrensis TaxID=29495 RepID=UPI001302216F|nr:DUF3549 family protein [Vibrio navarrensis]EGR2794679.1 DUF3549 family protein [Vibrio navarrensis]EJL6394162.1 DUF3549 family protein [Vibrio navarrensis]EJL6397255.1 DUF3549 family protein [Vibrio navarrensis]EJL6564592.1 DUF3549 family protein [Vibrio navarrensis]
MDTIHTLTQLLKNSHCEYTVFDLGRRIKTITNHDFAQIEQGAAAYPYPLQRKAHLAIAYWNEQKQPWVWFLKFELDERGLLKQADIGNFIKYIIEAMGTRLSQEMSEEQQQKLASNPYTFKPADDKMAVFHSQLRAQLDLPASQYYEHAQAYFAGSLGWDNWQTVGLQGITDLCARLDREQNGVLVRKALAHLPSQPLYALLGALEHTELPDKLAVRLIDLTQSALSQPNPDLFLISAYARALAGAKSSEIKPLLETILSSARLSHQEVLIGIAGRAWHWLSDSQTAERFLTRLAQTGNQVLFNQLFADLVMLPELRMVLLPLLHASPSEELSSALRKLQQATKG